MIRTRSVKEPLFADATIVTRAFSGHRLIVVQKVSTTFLHVICSNNLNWNTAYVCYVVILSAWLSTNNTQGLHFSALSIFFTLFSQKVTYYHNIYPYSGSRCSGGSKENLSECCSTSRPCGLGEGDCDKDSECKGALVCGTNLRMKLSGCLHGKLATGDRAKY